MSYVVFMSSTFTKTLSRHSMAQHRRLTERQWVESEIFLWLRNSLFSSEPKSPISTEVGFCLFVVVVVAWAVIWLWVAIGPAVTPSNKFNAAVTSRDHNDHQGWGAQDSHLNFHTAPELCCGTTDIQIDRYRYIYVCLCGIHQLSTPLSHKSPAPEATLTVVTLTATRPGLRALWANWTAVKLNLSLVDWGSLFCSELKPSISRWCLFVVVVVCISNSVCLFLCVCVCVWVKLTWPENCFSVMTVTSRKAIG